MHKSHNFAIGFSGLDLSSVEAFAYTLGRGLLSSAASAGVGMLASEAGLGGFVSSLAASIAGSYTNAEVMPQRNLSDNPNWRPTGLGSNSSVQFEHDGRGFHAVNIDFNQREFQATIDAVKTKIFEKSLDQGEPVAETVDLIRKTESDLTEIVNDAAATDAAFNEIDQRAKVEAQEKIIEVAEDAPVALKRQAQRENLNTLSTTIRKSAQEKICVIDEKIAAAETKKSKISAQLQHIPGAQEIAVAFTSSAINGLKSAKNGLLYVVKNPLEAATRAYRGITRYVGEGAEGGKLALEHPDIACDIALEACKDLGGFVRGGVDGLIVSAKHPALLGKVLTEGSGQLAVDLLHAPDLDVVEHYPVVGVLLEAARDCEKVLSGHQDLRMTTDKWFNFGSVAAAAICGKGGKKIAGEILEAATKAENKIHVKLTPYGGSGGGHHIHMKSAFKSHPMYDLNKALCLSNEEMARLGVNHLKVTKTQRALCLELQKTGKELTREELNRISVEALVVGGADRQLARDIVARSQWDLRSKGVRIPTSLPYKPK